MENIEITKEELSFIRSLKNFDLTMLLSEIHDSGWPTARELLPTLKEVYEKGLGSDG
jgi:hypothetical protein